MIETVTPSFRRITNISNILLVMAKFRKTISNYLRVAPANNSRKSLLYTNKRNNPQNLNDMKTLD